MQLIAAALMVGCGLTAQAVQGGGTRAAVLAELGEPQNRMAAGQRIAASRPSRAIHRRQ